MCSIKVTKSLIRDDIMDYFLSNNLFSDSQKESNYVIQLLKLIDNWTLYLEK